MLGKLLVPSKIDKMKNVAIKSIIFLSISLGIGTEGSSCILFKILIYKFKWINYLFNIIFIYKFGNYI